MNPAKLLRQSYRASQRLVLRQFTLVQAIRQRSAGCLKIRHIVPPTYAVNHATDARTSSGKETTTHQPRLTRVQYAWPDHNGPRRHAVPRENSGVVARGGVDKLRRLGVYLLTY